MYLIRQTGIDKPAVTVTIEAVMETIKQNMVKGEGEIKFYLWLTDMVFTYGKKKFSTTDRGLHIRHGVITASYQDFIWNIDHAGHLDSAGVD